jgi:hypothetical protein
MFDEGCLDRMQIIARCEPIDRGDGLSVVHHCKGQTRDDAVSFDQHRAGSALAVIATLFRTGQREVFTQSIQQCRAGIQRQRMRTAVDLKFGVHGRRDWAVVIDRAGRKSGARQRRQQQCAGSGLDHRGRVTSDVPGSALDSCSSMTAPCSRKPLKAVCRKASGLRPGAVLLPAGRHPAYGQVSSGRLMTTGVAVLRTTTHRNGSRFEGLISMCGRKAGT